MSFAGAVKRIAWRFASLGDAADGGLAGGAGGPVEEDVSLGIISNESFGGKGATLDVAGELAQGGAAATNGVFR